RDKLSLVQITDQKVADSISLLVGGQRVAKFTDRGRRYDVRARLQSVQRATPDQMDPLLIRAAHNRLVPLVDLIDKQTIATLPVIHRFAYQRKIEITANPAPGVSQGKALEATRAIMLKYLPETEGNVVELGNSLAMRETITSLVFALMLGIIVAYMILGVQFASFIHPLTVLLAMPFAVTGAFVTLWWGGDTLNMMSMIGLVLLMGLVKKNSIILVDYTNQVREGKADELHQEGPAESSAKVENLLTPRFIMSPSEAAIKACPIRLRPILMTSIATVAGAIPAAIGLGPGAETRAPMAKAIIGGIVLSTLVTLYLVPVFYVLVEGVRSRLGNAIRTEE
ncbi:MAG TPA: efflux RND transporter permease subunit, partial [Gemmatales bacterium]|nr:efflux RND transporter permease subunit [Gemmatales bacterium]